MHRRRRGSRGRLPIQPRISEHPKADRLVPDPVSSETPIFIDKAELEALRLVDLVGMYQEKAGRIMGISRGTIWRLLVSARKKLVQSIYEARPLVIGHPSQANNDY